MIEPAVRIGGWGKRGNLRPIPRWDQSLSPLSEVSGTSRGRLWTGRLHPRSETNSSPLGCPRTNSTQSEVGCAGGRGGDRRHLRLLLGFSHQSTEEAKEGRRLQGSRQPQRSSETTVIVPLTGSTGVSTTSKLIVRMAAKPATSSPGWTLWITLRAERKVVPGVTTSSTSTTRSRSDPRSPRHRRDRLRVEMVGRSPPAEPCAFGTACVRTRSC